MTEEARAERLLRLAAALDEAIVRLESRLPGASPETVPRLRRLQAELLTAASELDADAQPPLPHD